MEIGLTKKIGMEVLIQKKEEYYCIPLFIHKATRRKYHFRCQGNAGQGASYCME